MTDKKKNGWIKFVPSLDLPKERVSIAYDTHDERGYRFAYGYFQFYNGTCSCFWKDGNEQPKAVKAEDIKYWMPVPSFDEQEEPVSIWHDASEKPDVKEKSGIFVITSLNGEYIGSRYYNCNEITITLDNYDKWAYLNDLLNLSNVQSIGKNWKDPVSERFAFKAIPRLLEMIEPTDRAKAYIAKLADALEVEGYSTDAKIVMESLKIMNGEKVPMATMDEEPVSEWLEKASKEWLRPQLDKSYANYGEAKMMELTHFDGYAMLDAIEFGVKWKEQQLEKNRLKHCNSITKEQAELEQEFIDQHLDKHQRMPIFLDAIEFGMRLQKEHMMKGLCFETKVYLESDGCAEDFNESEWLDLEKTEITELPVDALGLKAGDKVKVIVIKDK